MALFDDWDANQADPLSRLVMIIYRYGHDARGIHLFIYRWLNLLVLRLLVGIDLPRTATIGPRLRLFHAGRGVVIHGNVIIGADVTVYQGVTIGARNDNSEYPTIGDGVLIGVGAAILGAITIGDGAKIGAHALVLHDVPAGSLVVADEAHVSTR